MISGHREVTCWADMRTRMILKHRKTALWTAGELGIVRRLSASRSENRMRCQFRGLLWRNENVSRITLDFGHLLLVLVHLGAKDDEGQPLEEECSLLQLLLFAAEQVQRSRLGNG